MPFRGSSTTAGSSAEGSEEDEDGDGVPLCEAEPPPGAGSGHPAGGRRPERPQVTRRAVAKGIQLSGATSTTAPVCGACTISPLPR